MKDAPEIPRRGEETRRRLVQAAVRVFGESGYDAVGTRDLAEAAGTNQAAIPYHFGARRVCTEPRPRMWPKLDARRSARCSSG